MLRLGRSYPFKYRIENAWEMGFLEWVIRGMPDATTQMIIPLHDLDHLMQEVGAKLETKTFSTVSDFLKNASEMMVPLLKQRHCELDRLCFWQPQVRKRFIWTPPKRSVEWVGHLIFAEYYGLIRVTFNVEAFAQIKPNELKAEMVELSSGVNPLQALRGRFPQAESWYFWDYFTGEVYFGRKTM